MKCPLSAGKVEPRQRRIDEALQPDRGGVGNESTRDHIESNSKEDHVDTGGRNNRDQRAADEAIAAAV